MFAKTVCRVSSKKVWGGSIVRNSWCTQSATQDFEVVAFCTILISELLLHACVIFCATSDIFSPCQS